MRTFDFDLLVSEDLTGAAHADRLFELFGGDVTPAVVAGTPLLMCSIEADDFAAAATTAVQTLREAGYEVLMVQAEPDVVAA